MERHIGGAAAVAGSRRFSRWPGRSGTPAKLSAHRLVLGRLPEATHSNASPGGSGKQLVYRLPEFAWRSPTKHARQRGDRPCQPVVGPRLSTSGAFQGGPKTILPPEGRQRSCARARCSCVGAIEARGTETAKPPAVRAEISSYGAAGTSRCRSSSGPPIRTPAREPTVSPATLLVPADRPGPSSGRSAAAAGASKV